jgi:hypothetical protein
LTTSIQEFAVRKRSYESVVLLHAEEAEQAIAIMREQGTSASLDYLMASYEPEESTLVDHRMPPWNVGDSLYENDEFVLYYNLNSPYIGLVRKLSRFSAA